MVLALFFLYFFTPVLFISSSYGIKCYICNTIDPDVDVAEKTCRYPNKRIDFKPKECTEKLLYKIKNTWLNDDWNEDHVSSTGHNPHFEITRQDRQDLGKQKGYEIKCVKQVLHNTSRPWFDRKPGNFSQIIRYCENVHKKDGCEKPCTEKQMNEGECRTCCDSNGCNDGYILSPCFNMIIQALGVFVWIRAYA